MFIGRKKALQTREIVKKIFNYNGSKWRKVRQLALERDDHLCQNCLDNGRVVEGNTVDHKVPVNNGGAPYALANLQTLCERCHAKKSQAERKDR
jgi:5-methylcytosine-specific restriction protein A